ETMSLYITTYQAMLPQVLKSKYERTLIKVASELPEELIYLFDGSDEVDYQMIDEKNITLKTVQQAISSGLIKERYKVKSQITKKYKTTIIPAVETSKLIEHKETLAQNAHRQIQILNFFIPNNKEIDQNKLFKELNITRNNLKPLIDKQLITLTQKEVYRNPYDREFPKTEKKVLTEEQSVAIKPIHKIGRASCREK